MRLRTAALLALIALVGAVIVAIALSVSVVIGRSARSELAGELTRSTEVLTDVFAYQQAELQNDASIVADEPRIRALFSGDVDQRTIRGGALRARARLGSDIFILTDEDGYVVVDVDFPQDSGQNALESPVMKPVIEAALDSGRGSGVWTRGERVFRVQARRVRIGRATRGVVLVGFQLGDASAQTLAAQIGGEVAVTLDDQVVAASDKLRAITGEELGLRRAQQEVVVDGRRYLAQSREVPGYRGERQLRFAVLRDLERALAPVAKMLRVLYLVFGAAIVVAIVLALVFSDRLARPIRELVSLTTTIAGGDLSARASVKGLAEVKSLGASLNSMAGDLQESRKQLIEKERLENELEIARGIQTSILPPRPALEGVEIAARMVTADEVGGDYYDVHPVGSGGWIAIGDACGHGLDAGLIMMMVQTSVATLVRSSPRAAPSELVRAVNLVVYENIHNRMDTFRHMTLSLLRVDEGGKVVMAGAHMDLLVLRAGTGECEMMKTPGTWIGIADDVSSVTVDTELEMKPGDLLILYTDGVTEATSAHGELFGEQRLARAVEALGDSEPGRVVDGILEAISEWQDGQQDDVTILAARWR